MPACGAVQPEHRIVHPEKPGEHAVIKLSLIVMFALSLATLSFAASAIPSQSGAIAAELH